MTFPSQDRGVRGASLPVFSAAKWILFLSIFTAGMTSFPLGIALLREFGSNPVNFVLPLALVLAVTQRYAFLEGRATVAAYLIFMLFGTLSIAMPLLEPVLLGWRDPIFSWFFQHLMLVWAVVALLAWKFLFSAVQIEKQGYQLFILMLIAAAIVLDLAAVNDILNFYFGIVIVPRSVIDVIAQAGDIALINRPSGLNSEPSHLGAWVAVQWPLLMLCDHRKLSRHVAPVARVVALVTIVVGALSLARTFYIAFLFQLVALGALSIRRFFTLKKTHRFLIFTLALVAIALFVTFGFARVATAFDLVGNGSSIARWDYTVAALRMGSAYPFTGTGLGQFTGHYTSFSNSFGVGSGEVIALLNEELTSRITSANAFIRLFAEIGVIGTAAYVFIVMHPAFRLLSCPSSLLRNSAILSLSAAVLSLMSTDEFAEPAPLFGIALAAYLGSKLHGETAVFSILTAAQKTLKKILEWPWMWGAGVAALSLILVTATITGQPAMHQATILMIESRARPVAFPQPFMPYGVLGTLQRAEEAARSTAVAERISRNGRVASIMCGRIVGKEDCASRSEMIEALISQYRILKVRNAPMLKIVALGRDKEAAVQLAAAVRDEVSAAVDADWQNRMDAGVDYLRTLAVGGWSPEAVRAGILLEQVLPQRDIMRSQLPLLIQASETRVPESEKIWPHWAPITAICTYAVFCLLLLGLAGYIAFSASERDLKVQ